MGSMASQITSLAIVYSSFIQAQLKRKHDSSALLALCRELTRGRWIPRTNGQKRGNVSIWWRHHVIDSFGYSLDIVWYIWTEREPAGTLFIIKTFTKYKESHYKGKAVIGMEFIILERWCLYIEVVPGYSYETTNTISRQPPFTWLRPTTNKPSVRAKFWIFICIYMYINANSQTKLSCMAQLPTKCRII